MKALIVEDNMKQACYVETGLRRAGFTCEITTHGHTALELLSKSAYDIIILDIMMPDISGLEVMRRAHETGLRTPIIILSALGETADRIAGLRAGADDYLSKPFALDELEARVQAVIRRASPTLREETLSYKDVTINLRRREVRRGSRDIILTDLEFRLLEYFLRNPERRLPSRLILEQVWNFEGTMTNVVEARIYALNKKLCENGESRLIRNARGLGYELR